jgi:transposase
MMYLRFDIGKRWHDAALLDADGETVWQLRFAPTIRVLNPLQTRAFRDANLRGVKTDRVDAVVIARLLRWEGTRRAAHTPAAAEKRQRPGGSPRISVVIVGAFPSATLPARSTSRPASGAHSS